MNTFYQVLGTSVIIFLFGGLWYSPLLFGRIWKKYSNLEQETAKPYWKLFIALSGTFLCNIVICYGIFLYLQEKRNPINSRLSLNSSVQFIKKIKERLSNEEKEKIKKELINEVEKNWEKDLRDGFSSGLFLSFFFVLPIFAINYMYTQRSIFLYLIDAFYQFSSFILASIVLSFLHE